MLDAQRADERIAGVGSAEIDRHSIGANRGRMRTEEEDDDGHGEDATGATDVESTNRRRTKPDPATMPRRTSPRKPTMTTPPDSPRKSIPPGSYRAMHVERPELMRAYEAFGEACTRAGPLDAKTTALVKLGISCAAGLEGAAHSHARKAIDAGCTRDEILHVAHLCAPTIGFPTMMRARRWVLDVVDGADES